VGLVRTNTAAKRPFLTAEYLPDAQGRLAPVAPAKCPRWASDGEPCDIVVKEWCTRKHGPGFKILACACYTHGGFRIYPIGWWPYGRVSLFGERNSLVRAVNDGAAGRRWPELARAETTLRTQRRWTSRWCRILAVEPTLDDGSRLSAALALGIDTLTLKDKANVIRAGPTSKGGRALVVMGILGSLDPAGLLQRVLRRGHDCSFWGCPIIELRGRASLPNVTRS
jgi:hypothetical protein